MTKQELVDELLRQVENSKKTMTSTGNPYGRGYRQGLYQAIKVILDND